MFRSRPRRNESAAPSGWTIYFSAARKEDIPEASKRIVALTRERHHLRSGEPDDFNIRMPEEVIRAQIAAANVFTLLLGGAASLSLLVGGIGIMNIMMVSVTERTKEIGIRLAIGATGSDIQIQFSQRSDRDEPDRRRAWNCLWNRRVLGASYHASLDMQLSQKIMIIAAVFSAGVGVFFGYYPARKASRFDPIEGLRFE